MCGVFSNVLLVCVGSPLKCVNIHGVPAPRLSLVRLSLCYQLLLAICRILSVITAALVRLYLGTRRALITPGWTWRVQYDLCRASRIRFRHRQQLSALLQRIHASGNGKDPCSFRVRNLTQLKVYPSRVDSTADKFTDGNFPLVGWPTQNFGWVGHSAIDPIDNLSIPYIPYLTFRACKNTVLLMLMAYIGSVWWFQWHDLAAQGTLSLTLVVITIINDAIIADLLLTVSLNGGDGSVC